jgi:pimeloyl-ACP methyl ester carboxylesterase
MAGKYSFAAPLEAPNRIILKSGCRPRGLAAQFSKKACETRRRDKMMRHQKSCLALRSGKGQSTPMTDFTRGADGLSIAYDVAGEGPPVVLIHGFAASRVITWRNTQWIEWLKRAGRRVIALDCRGHGESARPHDTASYNDELMIGDVLAVLDALEVTRADVMGYSMGGYMVANLLKLAPARVARAVIAGVGATYFSFWPQRNEVIADGLLAPDLEAVSDPLAREFRGFAERAGGDLVALAACMRRKRIMLSREDMLRILHPVLVVCGDEDEIAGRPEPLAELFPHGRAVPVPGKNHHSTVGDLVYKRSVREFLSE